ncbi:hypothetical protein GSI_09955 [Ganoderma sinense ZZ0214-1]|uniref:Uncharacterized protein n=1 Tax=Ganoderma sinense ZZ0214-1 TaxID=1077348 RepID=A0A2G8S2C0_9APHY|nr:hypothetical protein GSI_09955 [Ganoderma sinense ZZ0214-1]
MEQPLSRRDDMESLAYTIFRIYAGMLPWSHLESTQSIEISESKQVWSKSGAFYKGDCAYPLASLIEYAQHLGFDEDPDYDRWRQGFWSVDNEPAAPLPASDPLYDPENATECVPRNMEFIPKDPSVTEYNIDSPTHQNVNKIIYEPGSNHGFMPASEWGDAITLLQQDVMRDERGFIQNVVKCISEVPTTTVAHLAPRCPKEVMRKWDDPLPFKPVRTYVLKQMKANEDRMDSATAENSRRK